MKARTRWLLGGVGMALLAFAAFLAWDNVRDSWRAAESKHWPIAEGKIVVSWVEPEREASTNGKWRPSQPDLEYHYEVAGQTYRGWRISYIFVSGREESQKVVDRYPKGATVKVHYLPDDPSVSVLDPGGEGFNLSSWDEVLVFALLGLGCSVPLLLGLRKAPAAA